MRPQNQQLKLVTTGSAVRSDEQRVEPEQRPPLRLNAPSPLVGGVRVVTRGQGCPRSWRNFVGRDDFGSQHCKGAKELSPLTVWRRFSSPL